MWYLREEIIRRVDDFPLLLKRCKIRIEAGEDVRTLRTGENADFVRIDLLFLKKIIPDFTCKCFVIGFLSIYTYFQ
ncbi:MAG: hypothetical protein D6714_18115 [Bacteroidetes bacterium]|nr:MAG: hypothetical protein D6714_18115 [Bacteroidota bacterium]